MDFDRDSEADVQPVHAPSDAGAADPEGKPRTASIRRRGVGPFSLRQVTIAIVAVIGTAMILTLASTPIGTTTPGLPLPGASAYLLRSPVPGLRVGDLAPEFAGEGPTGRVELTDLDGTPIRLQDLRGEAVWINFWASWCPPCQSETPTIRSIDQRYRDRGLTIVAVQVQQTVEDGRRYAERYGLEYTIGADVTGAIFDAYRVFALPTQFFVDPDGVIRQIVNGPVDEARAVQLVEAILPLAKPTRLPTLSTEPAQP